MIEHGQLVNLICALRQCYALSADDRVLQFASLSFDMSVEECFGALCCGGTLVLRTDEWIETGAVFWQRCAEARVTVVNLPTSFWHQLVSDDAVMVPPNIRLILVGGERVGPEFLERWFRRGGYRPPIMNAYGPTEATVNAAIGLLSDSQSAAHLIGRPIANSRIYILDAHRQPVPIGVAGEIYIGGVGVARGYLNRAELTAERFVTDPFSEDAQARLYKTGDLGRWRADGNLEFLGSNDHQVKIRGYRIELGEIEAQLGRHAHVKEAVVLAREAASGGEKRLVAYVTTAVPTGELQVEDLRRHLKAVLPEYMVPGAYVVLDSLPLTPNGKVDRKALPVPGLEAYGVVKEYEPPQGEIEAILAGIWRELLRVERVGRQDNFFELGGHSLLAVQAVTRVRQGLGRDLSLRDLFQHPVLQDLCGHLLNRNGLTLNPILRADRARPLPASYAQQRLWFLDRL
jgi:acyl-coenzyme A synthetase/AMP-(fatty) acid ligase